MHSLRRAALLPLPPPPPPLQANYGKDDEAAVQRVKAVYRELQLEELFK